MKILELIWQSPEENEVIQNEFTVYSEEEEQKFYDMPLSEGYYFKEKPYSDRQYVGTLLQFIDENGYEPTENKFS